MKNQPFKNIPFCLAQRICTIVANANIRTAKLREILRNQEYPSGIKDAGTKKSQRNPN